VSSPHKVLGDGHMSVEVEVEASAPASAAGGLATPYAAVSIGAGVGGAFVVVRRIVGRLESE